MARDELSVLSAFLAVAEERSFTRAAKRIGATQSALSHAIRGLEEQIGVAQMSQQIFMMMSIGRKQMIEGQCQN